jgi:hypothetical protein
LLGCRGTLAEKKMGIESMLLTCGCSRPQQFLVRLPFGSGIQFFEILDLAAG